MTDTSDVLPLARDPSLLLEALRDLIEYLDSDAEEVSVAEQEVQLRAIAKAVEQLEKAGVAVPEPLRAEKTRIVAAIAVHREARQALAQLADELTEIVTDLRQRIGQAETKAPEAKPKVKRAKLPKTSKQILREQIVLALKQLGGRAKLSDVIEEMTRELDGKLLPGDLVWREATNEPAWQNNAKWALPNGAGRTPTRRFPARRLGAWRGQPMKFRKLVIENYKCFQFPTEIVFPEGENGRSIFLIGGMNGAGKTSIMEAVTYCLYGAKVDEIYRNINRREKAKGNANVTFELVMEMDDGSELIVKRSWTAGAASDPRPRDLTERLVVVRNGKRVSVQSQEIWQDFIRAAIPPGITQFFFFDGEKIQEIAADDHSEVRLKSSLEAALGIQYINRLAADIAYIKQEERKGFVAISDEGPGVQTERAEAGTQRAPAQAQGPRGAAIGAGRLQGASRRGKKALPGRFQHGA